MTVEKEEKSSINALVKISNNNTLKIYLSEYFAFKILHTSLFLESMPLPESHVNHWPRLGLLNDCSVNLN